MGPRVMTAAPIGCGRDGRRCRRARGPRAFRPRVTLGAGRPSPRRGHISMVSRAYLCRQRDGNKLLIYHSSERRQRRPRRPSSAAAGRLIKHDQSARPVGPCKVAFGARGRRHCHNKGAARPVTTCCASRPALINGPQPAGTRTRAESITDRGRHGRCITHARKQWPADTLGWARAGQYGARHSGRLALIACESRARRPFWRRLRAGDTRSDISSDIFALIRFGAPAIRFAPVRNGSR